MAEKLYLDQQYPNHVFDALEDDLFSVTDHNPEVWVTPTHIDEMMPTNALPSMDNVAHESRSYRIDYVSYDDDSSEYLNPGIPFEVNVLDFLAEVDIDKGPVDIRDVFEDWSYDPEAEGHTRIVDMRSTETDDDRLSHYNSVMDSFGDRLEPDSRLYDSEDDTAYGWAFHLFK